MQVKGKVTLFNVGSSFSYEAGMNGSRRYAGMLFHNLGPAIENRQSP